MKRICFLGLLIVLFSAPRLVSAQQKVGYINSVELMEAMPEMTDANIAFQAFQKQKQLQMEAMNEELQKKMAAYQEKYKTISEANKDVLEKELRSMENEIHDINDRMDVVKGKVDEEISVKQQEIFDPLIGKAKKAISAIAKEKNYAYVLDVSQPDLVFFAGGDDLSVFVKEKLGIKAAASSKTVQ